MDRPTFSPIKLDPAVESAIANEEDLRQTIAEVNAVLARHNRVMMPSLMISGDGKFMFSITFNKKPMKVGGL
jgi:hypothetical protein